MKHDKRVRGNSELNSTAGNHLCGIFRMEISHGKSDRMKICENNNE